MASRKTAKERKPSATRKPQQSTRKKSQRSTEKKSRRSTAAKAKEQRRRWSRRVTLQSNALDLDRDVFTWNDPARIARSLKRSAERSTRRKSSPYRSAMSMLTFYINRAGSNLGERRRHVLERAKDELRRAFGRESKPSGGRATRRRKSS